MNPSNIASTSSSSASTSPHSADGFSASAFSASQLSQSSEKPQTFVHKREVIYKIPPVESCQTLPTEIEDENGTRIITECHVVGSLHKHIILTKRKCTPEEVMNSSQVALVSDEMFVCNETELEAASSKSTDKLEEMKKDLDPKPSTSKRAHESEESSGLPKRARGLGEARTRTSKFNSDMKKRALELLQNPMFSQSTVRNMLRNEFDCELPSQATLSNWKNGM